MGEREAKLKSDLRKEMTDKSKGEIGIVKENVEAISELVSEIQVAVQNKIYQLEQLVEDRLAEISGPDNSRLEGLDSDMQAISGTVE